MLNKNTTDDDDSVQRPRELAAANVTDSQIDELIRNLITPEGSDYGLTPEAYAARERQTRKQIASGSLKIVFDEASDTTMLMTSQDWRRISKL